MEEEYRQCRSFGGGENNKRVVEKMKLLLYLLRWQASTPILSFVTYEMVERYGSLTSAIVANLIGGLIFYKIDKLIFK